MVTVPQLQYQYGYSITKKPVFASIVQSFKSGREVRNAQQTFPLFEYELKYETLKDQTQNQTPYAPNAGSTALEQLSSLFLFCNGQYGRFIFEDLSDCSRTGQILGAGDGTTVNFSIIETISDASSGEDFSFVIGMLNQSHPFTVYVNGVPKVFGVDYSVDSAGVQITFASAPANATTISMDFYFYYLCRFISDEQEFEQFVKNWWTSSIKFRSINTDPQNPSTRKGWVIHSFEKVPGFSGSGGSAFGGNSIIVGGISSSAADLSYGAKWDLVTLNLTSTVAPTGANNIFGVTGTNTAGTVLLGEMLNNSDTSSPTAVYWNGSFHTLQRGIFFPYLETFGESRDGTIGLGAVFLLGSPLRAKACYWPLSGDNVPYVLFPELNVQSYMAAVAIASDDDTVVGIDAPDGASTQAVVWSISGGTETVLNGPAGSTVSSASGISADGTIVVGRYGPTLFDQWEACYWTWPGGVVTTLPSPNTGSFHRDEVAGGISDDKTVICGEITRGQGGSQACVWRNGVIELLPDFAGLGFNAISTVSAISPDGNTVIGGCENLNGLGGSCVWKYETIVDA
jgi:uncharacterized protein (TIGR02217 family)